VWCWTLVLAVEALVPGSADGALFEVEVEVAGDLCSARVLDVHSLIDQLPVVTNDKCLRPSTSATPRDESGSSSGSPG
jgi:hypothetical protein